MSFTDLLTISMPCYERKDFFREALESALNQTIKCKIIVVDNCSSHNYFEEVCKEKGVTYYRNDRNIGMAANFSKAFELSATKYTMNLQDDDMLHPEYVESFLKAVNQYPDIDVFFSDFEMNTATGIRAHPHTLPFGYMKDGTKIIEYGIKYKMGFPYMTSAIKTIKAHLANDVTGLLGGYDWEWLYSNADNLSFFGDPKKLYLFRSHENQETQLNASIYKLTDPYIYDIILKEKTTDAKLRKEASKNAFWELLKLKSSADENVLKNYINNNTKYSRYLRSKIKENNLVKMMFLMPKRIVTFIYKAFRRIGIID